ncbi:MAG: ribonuclease H-like domain-containing protein [bacterium]
MNDDIIVYDIETQETFADVGSRDPKKLHISVIGAYSYKDNEFMSYTEDELPLFWRRLEQCDMIVGFNNKGFDDQVCAAYFPEITKVYSFDILAEVYKNLGFRVKLDNIAQATLGLGKSGDGLKAVRLYAEGKMEELRSYCLDDVKITRDIFDHGKQYGKLRYGDLAGVKEVEVDFFPEVSKDATLNLSLF